MALINVLLYCLIGITDSLKYNILVSCENYEVIGTNSFATNGPRKSRLDKEKLVNILLNLIILLFHFKVY